MWWISANPAPSPRTTELSPVRLEDGVAAHVGPAAGTWDMATTCHESTRSTPANATTTTGSRTTSPLPFDPRMRAPTSKLTGSQLIYLIFLQALPTMLIAGLINFGVGYPMYASPRPPPGPPPTGSIPPFLFRLPSSLVLDAAFTTVVQAILTWFPLLYLVNRALSAGEVAPLTSLSGGEPRSAVVRWFMMLDHHDGARGSRVCCGAGGEGAGGFVQAVVFALAGLGRAMVVAVVGYAALIWLAIPIVMAVATPFEGDWVLLGRWDGAVFKLVWGAVLGGVIAPAIAWMWMVRAGWIVRRHMGA